MFCSNSIVRPDAKIANTTMIANSIRLVMSSPGAPLSAARMIFTKYLIDASTAIA